MAGIPSTFRHDADVGVRGEGATMEEAFAAGARAMFGLMADLEGVRGSESIEVECSAPDRELLFVAWLNALLGEADVRGLVLCDFEVSIEGDRLKGRARGERFDPARHKPGVEVKGATLTQLRVGRTRGGFVAQTVVDV
jgi:SHS2 domain-containing protein